MTSTNIDSPAPPEDNEFTRRTALKMFSVTALLGMAAGCTRKPKRHIISVVDRPEYARPGIPLYYHSTWTEGDWPYGLQVKSIDGRPVKLEGHADHPLNRGKSNQQIQASLLSLYDPGRLRSPRIDGEDADWKAVDDKVVRALRSARSVVLVTRGLVGPSERALIERFKKAVPGAKHFVHAAGRERRLAWEAVYGTDGVLMPRFENAKVVLSLDSDFLGTDGDVISNTRGFASTRDAEKGSAGLSRLYVFESGMTLTGTNADHRVPLRPSAAADLMNALIKSSPGNRGPLTDFATAQGIDPKVLGALADDLGANRGKALIVAGPHLPPAVHAQVALLNSALGAPGNTLAWNPAPPCLNGDDPSDIAAALDAGPDVAIFLGVNPVHDWPRGWAHGDFESLLSGARLSVGHGLTNNETLAACSLALPSAHNLESWNDALPLPGVHTLCQPMIAPLFGGRQDFESLLVWTQKIAPSDSALAAHKDFHDFIRAQWGLDQKSWHAALRSGLIGTPVAHAPELRAETARRVAEQVPAAPAKDTVDVVLTSHPHTGDGRWSGNAWLQEASEPCSKLVWDNAAIIAPARARALGVEEGDAVTIQMGGKELTLPALIQPGVHADAVVAHVGYGRTDGAGVCDGVGVNVAPLVGTGQTAGLLAGATVKKGGGESQDLVRTQRVFDQDEGGKRHIARAGTAKQFADDPDFLKHEGEGKRLHPQIDEPWDYSKGRKWAMSIDMNKCTGCEACVVACQSENNVPVVGKEECSKGRDMSWIRLDRYESGDESNPEIMQQVMVCQHCDNAPCETVCPVNATAHSPEGINEQTYNRCVGTRYCLNNCPYKVRRFNFFNYTKEEISDPVQELRHNPHVTVRSRGVMEKCTFCIQRINAVKFEASNKGIELTDGAVTPACQQACPADAIAFGDANIEGGRIAEARGSKLAYHVLEELNVRPNVTYKVRLRNAHPNLEPAKGGH